MTIDLAVIDDLLKKFKTPEEILGDNGLLKQLTKAVLQRALQAEMTHHLGHEKHASVTNKNGNARNGSSAKTLKGDFGTMPIEIPRDRDGSFEPLIIGKGQTRFAEFDSKIISLYSRGMTTREIKGHLEEIYGVEVSPTLISTVTEAVMEEVKIWQNRQATGFDFMEEPRSACIVSCPRWTFCLAQVAAISSFAKAADSRWANIHPTTYRLKMSRIT